MSLKVSTFDIRETSGAFVVTALAAGFGTIVVGAAEALTTGMMDTEVGGSEALRGVLLTVSWVFLGLSFFVGGIVTANTFSTIIVGRAQRLALFRLLGASAKSLRRGSMKEGLLVGIAGTAVGGVTGIALTQATVWAGKQWWGFPAGTSAPYMSVSIAAPLVAAALMTTVAAWKGSGDILTITPIEAFGNAQSALETREGSPVKQKSGKAWFLFIAGAALLALGIFLGLSNPLGVLIAFPGGALTFIAFMLAADRIMPRILRAGGASRSAPALLAARNTARNPHRATRTSLGIIIGVGMISMFAVVGATYLRVAVVGFGEEVVDEIFILPALIILVLVGFSTVLAVVGLINTATLNAIQRRREIALLRALGLTKKQVRNMVSFESLRLAAVSAVLGLAFGVFYGWAGSVSSLGTAMKMTGMFAPDVPWQLVVGVLIGTLIVTVVTTTVSMRKVTSAKPMEALAEG